MLRKTGAVLAAVLSISCSNVHTTRPGAVGVEREQMMFASTGQVNREADGAYRQTLQQAQKNSRLNQEPGQLERVRGISDRLIVATGVFRPDAPN